MGRAGFELNSQKTSQPPVNKKDNKPPCPTTNHETVHNPVHNSDFPSDLQEIIKRWDGLPEHIKAAIKALMQTHKTKG